MTGNVVIDWLCVSRAISTMTMGDLPACHHNIWNSLPPIDLSELFEFLSQTILELFHYTLLYQFPVHGVVFISVLLAPLSLIISCTAVCVCTCIGMISLTS